MQLRQLVQVQSIAGEPVIRGDVTVTPRAQVIRINGIRGWSSWVRPTSILVEREGSRESIPIVDITIVAVLAIAVFSFIFSLALRPRRNRRNENA